MTIRELAETPSWDWPEGAGELIAGVLVNRNAEPDERLTAAELAGDPGIIGDGPAAALLSVLVNPEETDELRCTAAISLGPILESVDTGVGEDTVESPVTEEMFDEIREVLQAVQEDPEAPREVRRSALEASVRAPEDWHEEAIRAAYADGDDGWRMSALFCMRFVPGFEKEILEGLASGNLDIRYEALCAAAAWGVEGAWPYVEEILDSGDAERRFLLAAIEGAASIRPEEAAERLAEFAASEDEEIAEAAHEALLISEAGGDDRDGDQDEDYGDEDGKGEE